MTMANVVGGALLVDCCCFFRAAAFQSVRLAPKNRSATFSSRAMAMTAITCIRVDSRRFEWTSEYSSRPTDRVRRSHGIPHLAHSILEAASSWPLLAIPGFAPIILVPRYRLRPRMGRESLPASTLVPSCCLPALPCLHPHTNLLNPSAPTWTMSPQPWCCPDAASSIIRTIIPLS